MWHLSSSRAWVSCDLHLIFVLSFKMYHLWLTLSGDFSRLTSRPVRNKAHSQIRQKVRYPGEARASWPPSLLVWVMLNLPGGQKGVSSACFLTFLASSCTYCTECLRSCWTLLWLVIMAQQTTILFYAQKSVLLLCRFNWFLPYLVPK